MQKLKKFIYTPPNQDKKPDTRPPIGTHIQGQKHDTKSPIGTHIRGQKSWQETSKWHLSECKKYDTKNPALLFRGVTDDTKKLM